LCAFIFFSPALNAQTNTIDSLENIVNSNVHDTVKIQALIAWDNIIYNSDAQKDREINLRLVEICSFNLNNELHEAETYVYKKTLGWAYNNLGLQFKKIEKPSVWSDDVQVYEVYDGDTLKGRFYLDLYPRPNKETWFYGMDLASGKSTTQGYQVPVKMLLGNFTKPTETMPSLLSFRELETLFHEFGHIMEGVSYEGEYSLQSNSMTDFAEAMSQMFENWLRDYDVLSSFAKHYKTGEVLPKELFDNMKNAENLSSGLNLQRSLRNCIYDMNLYDKYDPEQLINTDELWKNIDNELGVLPLYVEGTHPQACWIHINTHPTYYYGYLWSEVYAQDMFTVFKKNGLRDTKTGERYRKLILANGSQRDIIEAVEEFLGRPSNNEAYIKSLGLE